jgi:hypothetical protein
MSEQNPTGIDLYPGRRDEVAGVLAALRALSQKVSNPMVRVCLESACEDIAHLTGTDDGNSTGLPGATEPG